MPLLTDLLLRRTRPPATGRTELWDTKVTGLVWRITASGARSWSVSYRPAESATRSRTRLTLGAYRAEDAAVDGLTLGEARAEARRVLRDVADGRDPQAEKRKARLEAPRVGRTFKDLAELWLASPAAAAWRPKTRSEFGRLVRRELVPALGHLAPEAVTKREIRAIYDGIAARSVAVAKHALAVLRLLFTWASDEDHIDVMPVFPKRGTQSERRTRVLEPDELRAVWHALAGFGVMGEAFRLMLVTAQRRGEVLSLRWADVTEEQDGAWWTIPAERHKGGRPHRVPLTGLAIEALKRLNSLTGSGEWAFPSPKPTGAAPFVSNPQKAAGRLWGAVGLKGSAHVHDFRRSAATYMVRLGVPRLVVARVLGHADSDVTGRYDVHAYDREKRRALTKWAAELHRTVTEAASPAPAGKVLPWAR